MNVLELKEKHDKIVMLEKVIGETKECLSKMKEEYYRDYFNAPREDYAKLTDVPLNPDRDAYHPLAARSMLNIDAVGDMICELFQEYEHQKVFSKQLTYRNCYSSSIEPYLSIGPIDTVNKGMDNEQNILIYYEYNFPCSAFENRYNIKIEKPAIMIDSKGFETRVSNYNFLLKFCGFGDIKFDYKGYEFIRELIYSLAYYQSKHNISAMTSRETWDVFRKIYKKK